MLLASLKRRKLRTFFVLLGVALGIASMVALNAVTQGTIHQYERLASEFRGDIMVQRAGMPDPVLSQIDPSMVEQLKSISGVSDAYAVAFYAIKFLRDPNGSKPGTRFFVITGMLGESSLMKRHQMVSGRYPKEKSTEIVLGDIASSDSGLKDGDSLLLDNHSYTIVGTYHTGIRLMDKGAIVSLSDIQELRHTKNVNLVVLDLKNPSHDIEEISSLISRQFPDLEPLKSSEVLDNFDQVKIFRSVAFGISLIALTLAVIAVLNTMMMSVYERTKELGILRAVGWSNAMLISLIVKESVLISSLGGLFGIALGVVGTECLIKGLDIGLVDAYYPASLFIYALLLSVLVGLFGSIIPTLRALSISPVEALRHE